MTDRLTRPLRMTPDWRDSAACFALPQEIWFPDREEAGGTAKHDYRLARTICGRCPVSDECLRWAVASDEKHGMWGGHTPDEILQLRRTRRQAAS